MNRHAGHAGAISIDLARMKPNANANTHGFDLVDDAASALNRSARSYERRKQSITAALKKIEKQMADAGGRPPQLAAKGPASNPRARGATSANPLRVCRTCYCANT